MTGSDLAVVAVTETEFEAQTKAAVLRARGIEAAVTSNAPSWTGQLAISPSERGASVLVHESELERARGILASTIEDSVDLDWDEVDVGEREDDLPLLQPGRVPPLASFATAVVWFLIAASMLAVLVTVFLSSRS